jgi:hypothetical protein
MDHDALDLFVEKVVAEKKFPELDPEVLAQIKADVKVRAEQHINVAILAALPPEKIEEFDKLLDTATEADIQKFVGDNIPDPAEVTALALINFRNSYLGV